MIKNAPTVSGTGSAEAKPLRLVDPAVPAAGPVSPRTSLNLLAGVIGGLMAGLGVAYARAYLRDAVDDARDAEDLAQAPVLGHVRVEDASKMGPDDREGSPGSRNGSSSSTSTVRGSRSHRPGPSPSAGLATLSRSGMPPAVARPCWYVLTGALVKRPTLPPPVSISCSAAAASIPVLCRRIRPNLRVMSGGVGLEAAAENASRDRPREPSRVWSGSRTLRSS